ncbi:hypothetical protein [Bradyrhizobium genomosp. III]|uniref:hypothetical protein n=1 Tax=Bradyrhizobium genomosp. III TaxID=2683271 RepID=UPI00057643B2|nr:hypothetical protein [Bradyrhizobium sp. CCBAU 15635]
MNGPVIINNARELLADDIFAYREPRQAPLKISPWLAMSLLQKAIRRGEAELAQHAAATLLLVAPDRLWRRCGAAAFEDIGAADLQTVSLVTAALTGKKYRATIGGEWKVASFITDQMTKAPKCRAADDLLLTADSHPTYRRARVDLATKTTAELIHIATGDAALPVRALATWYAVGTHPRQTKHLSVRPREPVALFDGLCEAGLPHTAVEIAREGYRKIGEPLCPFVALLCPLACQVSTLQDDDMPPAIMVGEVPGWAMDLYSREGRGALQAFLRRDCDAARWVKSHVPAAQRVNFLGTVVFRVEGGLVRQRARWPTGDELRRLVDIECHGSHCPDATEILQLARADLGELNAIRAELMEASSHVS